MTWIYPPIQYITVANEALERFTKKTLILVVTGKTLLLHYWGGGSKAWFTSPFPPQKPPASSSPGIIIVSSSSRMKTMGTCGQNWFFMFLSASFLYVGFWDSGVLMDDFILPSNCGGRISSHKKNPSTNPLRKLSLLQRKTKKDTKTKLLAGGTSHIPIFWGEGESFSVTFCRPRFWKIPMGIRSPTPRFEKKNAASFSLGF